MKKLLKKLLVLVFIGSICPAYGMLRYSYTNRPKSSDLIEKLDKHIDGVELFDVTDFGVLAGIELFRDTVKKLECYILNSDQVLLINEKFDRLKPIISKIPSKQAERLGDEISLSIAIINKNNAFINTKKFKQNFLQNDLSTELIVASISEMQTPRKSFWHRTKQAICNNKFACAFTTVVTGLGITYCAYQTHQIYKSLFSYPIYSYPLDLSTWLH